MEAYSLGKETPDHFYVLKFHLARAVGDAGASRQRHGACRVGEARFTYLLRLGKYRPAPGQVRSLEIVGVPLIILMLLRQTGSNSADK